MPPGLSTGKDVAPAALIDTHAHFHETFRIDEYFSRACDNLDRGARELGTTSPRDAGAPARVLLVMETGRPTLLERLSDTDSGDWRVAPAGEPGAAIASHAVHGDLVLVEGRQVVTRERVELLAAPCAVELASGESLDGTLERAIDLGAVPILPWGVGKWLGRRGKLIARLLEAPHRPRLLLGDNGGRLGLGWTPRLLTLGAQRGLAVVRGSDPLPLAAEQRRVGSFGSLLRGPFDRDRPATAARTLLRSAAGNPPAFGRGVGPIRFVTNQLRIRFRGAGR